MIATQERFVHFQDTLQRHLRENMTLASMPCGRMDDLLRLDYSKAPGCHLVGCDLDPESLNLAANLAQSAHHVKCTFQERDAWNLENYGLFDMVTSNGLTIYEPDPERCIAFYEQVFNSLKPRGIFVTSFLTPPPTLSPDSTWQNVDPTEALKQKAVFGDIIGATWQAFRTQDEVTAQLETAQFAVIDIIYDSQGIFPTIVAQKPD